MNPNKHSITNEIRPLAVVTGAARGIGFGITRRMVAAGYHVIMADLLAGDDTEFPGKVTSVEADIATADGRKAIVKAVDATGGSLHALINNAGVSPKVRADVTIATEESYDRLMSINARGPHFLTQALVPALRQGAADGNPRFGWEADRPGSSVVFITSSNAMAVSVDRSEYCMSKAALQMASKIWSVRLAEWGIPVYDILPGLIETEMTAPTKEKYQGIIESGTVLQRRWGTPDDIGKTVVAMVTGMLGYATGQSVFLDGGFLLSRF